MLAQKPAEDLDVMNLLFLPLAQFQVWPEQASKFAGSVDLLFWCLAGLMGAVTLGIAVVIVFFLARYRRNANPDRTHPDLPGVGLEIVWSALPLVIFVGMFGWGANLYLQKNTMPTDAMEVHVIGKQWMWKLQHLQGKREINELHVPVGRKVELIMTSQDVIHSFFLPAFRIKQDVLPGKYTKEWFEADKTGVFPIFCAQYCGAEHALMIGRVVVMDPVAFADWLNSGRETVSVAQAGETVYRTYGCSGCHENSSAVDAPSLHGLFGKWVRLQDGRDVVADERYLRDAMLQPESQIVAGYEPSMPSFRNRLSEDDVFAVVSYLKSLGRTPTTAATQNH